MMLFFSVGEFPAVVEVLFSIISENSLGFFSSDEDFHHFSLAILYS